MNHDMSNGMSHETDPRIADLLRAEAPAPRDPLFRVRVLERREERRYRRRLYTMLVGILVIFILSASAISIGVGAGGLGIVGTIITGAALATAWLAFRGSLSQILRRFSI